MIEDATVFGEVGRMVIAIAIAYDHFGEKMAVIVNPRSEIHEIIWTCEHGGGPIDLVGGADASARREELRDAPAAMSGLRRAVNSGALEKEMQTVYERISTTKGPMMRSDTHLAASTTTAGHRTAVAAVGQNVEEIKMTTLIESGSVERDYGFVGTEAIVEHPEHGRLLLCDGYGSEQMLQAGAVRWFHGVAVKL